MPIQPAYRERVLPSFGAFIPLVLLPPVGWLTFALINPLLGVLIGSSIAVAAAALMIFWSPKIEINDSVVRVGRAQIPQNKLGKATVIDRRDVFAERGPKLNAIAYVQLQSSVKGLVKVTVSDPEDSTPYWLFSTRKPKVIADLLNKKRKSS